MTSPQMARLDEHFQRLRLNTAMPLRSQPGTEWFYSILVDVQGYLVEKLSGQPFDEFLLKRILSPSALVDTADGWVREPASSRGFSGRSVATPARLWYRSGVHEKGSSHR